MATKHHRRGRAGTADHHEHGGGKPVGVRERILDAALAILAESGLRNLTQVGVANRARVRQSHLTYYFPTRDDLLEAVTARAVDGIATGFHRVATDAKGVARHEAELRRAWGPAADRMIPGALLGTPDRARDIVASYFEAGADLVTIALRAPWEAEALDAYLGEVVPKLR